MAWSVVDMINFVIILVALEKLNKNYEEVMKSLEIELQEIENSNDEEKQDSAVNQNDIDSPIYSTDSPISAEENKVSTSEERLSPKGFAFTQPSRTSSRSRPISRPVETSPTRTVSHVSQ